MDTIKVCDLKEAWRRLIGFH